MSCHCNCTVGASIKLCTLRWPIETLNRIMTSGWFKRHVMELQPC
jgi:hypothetical protein